MSFDSMLFDTCSIYAPATSNADASGGNTISWTARATGVPCNIKPNPGGEVVTFGQRNIRITHRIALSSGAAQSGDKITNEDGVNILLVSIEKQFGRGNIATFYWWSGGELLPGE